ncbi:MAG: aconitate hydratase AcnA [Armatimonadetes bacterium CG_4_10_14_3_um_filter_66_18]|nr:aconitate hydratase AcnA [Armatimonadota bacterium]OIO97593.1 MAG: aconitate hydratase 1 [Armatimonadetes bacterium CG2_30_66_41]PIU94166.1 MAG: aconitate hydratase AcnA [Armatimonadetes bacterium CG06_land_8_20_14_3_00_66_21]PIX37379.1 MAG: aconitate hydratase AcnA [Armatimonadetes bacterium CG_4_8_14_3_um_filter_66_20]PIY44496.1 MAG: aconitate hydratase AcnA [Armatimonadetes bacterium CG_4_10_14_3_um_filter_66_18]PJB60417.1 MAG: aconitate hydratase AcnA [Armatimonadetes bacterium CG_4_9_1
MSASTDTFGAKTPFETGSGTLSLYRLQTLEDRGVAVVSRLPFSLKVLLESVLRRCDGHLVTDDDVTSLAQWRPTEPGAREIPFMPARVLLQDFTGVPAVVDLAALRSAMQRAGGDPNRTNPLIPADLVIDHSVNVDFFGTSDSLRANGAKEFERNRERYALLRWAQEAFDNLTVVPPNTGICHQVNLEFLAKVVRTAEHGGETVAFPDSLVGTDSHTTMINGLSVLGWGVGGIEAEAVMLGQPYYMLPPEVLGFRLFGQLPAGATATDLVLTVTQKLRQKGVVGKFVEFYGTGLSQLPLADRATLANMSPEYGATMGFFPVDEQTLTYLRGTGRDEALVELVERYTKEQGLFRTDETPAPEFTDTFELDLSTVEPSLAGPKRPQDRVPLRTMKTAFAVALREVYAVPAADQSDGSDRSDEHPTSYPALSHGSVVIAAITSCTNTSNPSVMIGAGLLAKKAVQAGLTVPPWVKTSLAPGSRVVTRYLENAGLLPYLEALRFHVVGYGCTTCIGNSGKVLDWVAREITDRKLVVASVLSGNRNFEGRINPLTRANYLASPPLVVAYALAGRVDVDLSEEPIGRDPNGKPVYLRDLWPSPEEIQGEIAQTLRPALFTEQYAHVYDGDEQWNAIPLPEGGLYAWDETSSYVLEPPFFVGLATEPLPVADIRGARALAVLGDTVTTDHISPAGTIPGEGPAGKYLLAKGIEPRDFNSFGSRRGNHEVMRRGTFANIRLRNELAPGTEGGVTIHLSSGEQTSLYDAAERYQQEGIPLIVLAGKEYGTGSSRDWAAKGTHLLGVRAVLAESYERIHRGNLVGMGVLPLQFRAGETRQSLGLTGREVFSMEGLSNGLSPEQEVIVCAVAEDGAEKTFTTVARLDTPVEVEYYRNGGILQTVLRRMLRCAAT